MEFKREVIRFGLVGTVGFIVDGGLLATMIANGANHLYARGISFPAAVFSTWLLNRRWTFSMSDRSRPGKQFSRYFLLQVVGAFANLAFYSLILSMIEPNWMNALVALAVGSTVGLVINFTGSKYLIFGNATKSSEKQSKSR